METLKRKRGTTHNTTHPTSCKPISAPLCFLHDGRHGYIVAWGWLDSDGSFYEVKEGGIAKIQYIDECKYMYIHKDNILRVSPVHMSISLR